MIQRIVRGLVPAWPATASADIEEAIGIDAR